MTRTVVIAGGTGTIGSACANYLRSQGFRVRVLSRSAREGDDDVIRWDPEGQWIAKNIIDGAFAVIHLTGKALPDRRWTTSYRKILRDSRLVPARFLGELIAQSAVPPAVYIGMSAAGIYGDAGQNPVSESDVPPDNDRFVVRLVKEWEHAHTSAANGLRTVILRCPPVLTTEAGFLPRMLEPARFGIYPYFGSGRQMLSWVTLEDVCRAFHHALEKGQADGVYNLTAREVVSSREFIARLRSARGKAGILAPVPKVLIRIVFGQMAQILFDSINLEGEKFRQTGFVYAYDRLDAALANLLSA